MMHTAFSIVCFAVLKWTLLKLFKTPEGTEVPMLQTTQDDRKSSGGQVGI